MKKSFLFIALILGLYQSIYAQKNQETFTIYLVRHAEKDISSSNFSDPSLTKCGEQRAESISNFLQQVDLQAIYSTDYNRTKSTARPTAKSKKIEIEIYKSSELEAFSDLLIDRAQDALVVGHSNTTGVLAGLLVGKEIGAFDLDIYNRVYQVVVYKKCGRLHLFHTAFDCKE